MQSEYGSVLSLIPKSDLFTCMFVFILLQKPVVSGDLLVPGTVSLVSVVPSQSAVSPTARSLFLLPTPGQESLSDF